MIHTIQAEGIAGAFPSPHHLGEEDIQDTKDLMAVPSNLQKLQDQRGRDSMMDFM